MELTARASLDDGVAGWLRHHAARAPCRPFLLLRRDGLWEQYGYGDAAAEAGRWAAILRARGVGPGHHVVVVLPHRAELYFAFLGAAWIGAIPTIVPFPTPKLDPALYWAEYVALLGELAPAAIVTYERNVAPLRDAIGRTACAIIDADAAPEPGAEQPGAPAAAAPDEPCVLQFSSGTTGRRKGVPLTPRLLAAQMAALGATLAIDGNDRVASWLPLYHDMGLVGCFLAPLCFGAAIVALDPFEWAADPAILLDAIDRFRATLVWMPNFAFQHVVRTLPAEAGFRLDSIRAFVSSAETCRPETMTGFVAALGHLGARADQMRPSYGMAETVLAATMAPPRPEPRTIRVDAGALEQHGRARVLPAGRRGGRRLASCGPLVPGLELRIADRGDGPGIPVGEIELRGAACFAGYFRNVEATADALRDGWYRTGDLGFLEGGELFVCGRTKDVVVVNGRNFHAPDIEAAAAAARGIRPGRVCAFGVEDAEIGSERLVVLVETVDGRAGAALLRGVKSAIVQRLQVMAHRVVPVPPGLLVKTSSGKMHRAENRRRYLAGEIAA